jgi:hypothetical protein
MMAGQFIGARAGSRLVLSKGQSLIRPMIVIVSAVMSAKLLYDSHGQRFFSGWEFINATATPLSTADRDFRRLLCR